MLQLHKIERGTEYGEFLHAPKKRFTDFGKSDLQNDSFCFLGFCQVYLVCTSLKPFNRVARKINKLAVSQN